VSNLSIGLVTSPSEECKQMAQLLKDAGLEIRYHISPEQIKNEHIEDSQLSVWLLSVNDDDWHDNIDQLLDESDASIYFNEPGTLEDQSHPEYWCKSLISRLYEITGLEEVETNTTSLEQTSEVDTEMQTPISEPVEELSSALDELESSSIDLPSDVAADLVSELERISPDLNSEPPQQSIDDHLSSDDAGLKTETETETETATDYLSELVAERASESSAVGEFDEIDFSNTQTPMLESAKGGIDDGLKANYEISDDSAEHDENDGLELDKILNSPEPDSNPEPDSSPEKDASPEPDAGFESKDQSTTEDLSDVLELEMFSEPDEGQETELEQSFDRANFLHEDASETDQTAETDESISDESDASPDLMGLALESIEPEKITGKSSFIEQEEQIIPELNERVDEDLDGLTLESNQEEAPTGKAVFIEEEVELEPAEEQFSVEVEAQGTYEDDGLTLESNGNEAPTGRAIFDDGELVEETAQDEPKVELQDQFEDLDDGGLTLESDGRQPTEGIAQYQLDDEPVDESKQSKQVEQAAQADLGDEFEIPMLEESVTNLDFDEPEVFQQTESSLTPCWIIGASLGGPAAVKRFFQALPADVDACFVVVQHIEESFLPVMADILSSNSQFEVAVANGSNTMQPGKVYLAPLKGKIVFLQDGSMLVDHSQKWSEPYTPCINDVIGSAASVYGEISGTIIFSGMGEDGLIGCEKMSAVGGAVWAQSAETCANPSMPNAVINANLASVVATPEMLADRLVKTLSEKVYG